MLFTLRSITKLHVIDVT